MEYVDIIEEIRRLEAAGAWEKLSLLDSIAEEHPDLKLFRDPYGRILFCAASAAPYTEDIELNPSSHDCDGAPLQAWVFVCVDKIGTRVYSDPPFFIVADQNVAGFGEIPRNDWRDHMKAAHISRFAMEKVADYLRRHPPINYVEDEDANAEANRGTGEKG